MAGLVARESCTKNRFGLPGGKGGIPERMVFYDFGHVIAGYDTRPESEIQQGAFQCGFVREDGFAFLMFVIIQFHLRMKVTPITDGQIGLFDVPKVLRGAAGCCRSIGSAVVCCLRPH